MSSEMAMKKYAGGVAEYRASEGKTVEVPFKGDVEHTIRDILGGSAQRVPTWEQPS